ncbi:MAG: patatin-like phospholipase family protein [Myxococcota bacterium]
MGAPRSLVIRAGVRAAARLREEGFHADLFDTLVGASGGPKWLVLRHLDEVLIERVILARERPLDTLGSSIGSFRHACFAQRDPIAALARFADAYTRQAYHGQPTPETISRESERILADFLAEHGAEEIAANDVIRSHFVAARLRRDRGLDRGTAFRIQLAAAASRNLLSRRNLGRSFERILFARARPVLDFDDFPTHHVPLDAGNVRAALMASGSIPLVMAGVRDVPGAPGTLFDGGILDYHFDFAFRRRPGLVLFPHFFDRITPGWFDKLLPWRAPRGSDLADVVLIAPSDAFIARIPGRKVPDRDDFLKLGTQERITRWLRVQDESKRLADEFATLVDSGRLADAILPFPTP